MSHLKSEGRYSLVVSGLAWACSCLERCSEPGWAGLGWAGLCVFVSFSGSSSFSSLFLESQDFRIPPESLGWAGLLLQGDGLLAPAAWRDASALSSSGLGCPCNNRIIKTKLKQQKNLILLLFHFVFNITCSAAGAGFRHFFSCSLLELLVRVWAGLGFLLEEMTCKKTNYL